MEGFYYVYVLWSEKDENLYTGYSANLSLRLQAHHKGEVKSTAYRRPMHLIYYEACLDQADALKREKYLKTHYGKMFLKNRLKSYFTRPRAGR
jgi:putative endonuclease